MLGTKPYEKSINMEREDLIKKAAYSLNDGIMSISAVLALFLGLGQRADTFERFLLVAVIAGALSLAVGEFISTRTKKEDYLQEEHDARMEVQLVPELKKEEIRSIYAYKGFKRDFLDEIVDHITIDEDWLVRELALDETAIAEVQKESETKNALIVLVAFLIGSLFPLLPYAFAKIPANPNWTLVLVFAIIVIIFGLFFVGAMKTFITNEKPVKEGVKMVLYGMLLFVISYGLGALLKVMGA